MIDRDAMALEVLKKIMNRVNKRELTDEVINKITMTAYAITDSMIKESKVS